MKMLSFFVTAGRGTENFAANEIIDKLTPQKVSIRDGKVFFQLSSTSALNIQRILALRSVERLFVAVTDYDNINYTQTKRMFLDKLMSTLSQRESFLNAKYVLDQLTLVNNKNGKTTKDEKIVYYLQNSDSVHAPETKIAPNGHHFTVHPNTEDTLRNTYVCIEPINPHVPKQDLEVSCAFDVEPAEKYRKLEIPCSTSEMIKKYTPLSVQERQIVLDSSSGCSKQIDPNCEDHTFMGHSHASRCSTTFICSGPHQGCHSECLTESDRESSNEGCVSFRMSVKCSGKVSKWINLKKLSRDLGWRVARATGWKIELRHPQYEVCLHISNEHVTVGVPLTRFPLSRRVNVVDSGLRAPVAWIMSQLGSIKPGDVVLDPMCGKATILIEAHSNIMDAWFMGSDSNSSQIDKALQNLNTCGHWDTVSLLKADGLNMPFRDNCLDVVLCDAPFNQNHLFELTSQTFYSKFIKEISRVLRPDGRCVLLVSEQLKHIILPMVQGMQESHKIKGTLLSEGSYPQEVFEDYKEHDACRKTTDAVVPLTFVSSHYMKLGETHACIIVLHKLPDLTRQEFCENVESIR